MTNNRRDKYRLNTAIFDMDGLLIDSEPLWRKAEKEAFRKVGLELTDEMCARTTGFRTDEVVSYWYERHPWQGKSKQALEEDMTTRVIELVSESGEAMPGAYDILQTMQAAGFRLALASSSPYEMIDAVLAKLQIESYFEFVYSATEERNGKPDPAVYLTTARRLQTDPNHCLAFEDSLAGVRAAKAAAMITIAVPAAEAFHEPQFDIADLKLSSLEEFSLDMLAEL